MALTAYAGVRLPTVYAHFDNDAQAQPSAAPAAVLADLGTNIAPVTLLAGDYLIVPVHLVSGTAVVSSMALSGSSGVTFSRLLKVAASGGGTLDVWISNAIPTAQVLIASTLTATVSASVTNAMEVMIVRDASGVPTTSSASTGAGSNTTQTVNGTAVSNQNTLAMAIGTTTASGGPVVGTVIPASMGSIAAVNNLTAGVVVQYGPIDGSSALVPSATFTAPTGVMVSMMLQWPGVNVSLDDLTYQVRDVGGLLLNNPSAALPIYDVQQVAGLDDVNVNPDFSDIDGSDGSYLTAKYASGKTVVIDGTIFGSPPFDETLADNLKYSCRPTSGMNGVPFYFKFPSKTPRVLYVKPVAAKAQIDRSRTLSQVPYQVQLMSADARSYTFPRQLVASAGTGAVGHTAAVTPGGNARTPFRIYFSIYSADTVQLWAPTFSDGLGNTVGVSPGGGSGGTPDNGQYCLDFGAHTLKCLTTGNDMTKWLNGTFWLLKPNETNAISMLSSFGTSHLRTINEGFWVSYADAWL